MRGLGAALFALVLVAGHEATGFVAPLSTFSIGGTSRSVCGVRGSSSFSASTRLHMSTSNLPKFSVSLTDDARVTFHLDKETLQKLAQQVNNILASFKRLKENAAKGGKPYREDTVEFKDTTAEGLNILMECNPNIFPDPFKAQVFVRVWDDKFEISSQAMLTKLTDAMKLHMASIKAQA